MMGAFEEMLVWLAWNIVLMACIFNFEDVWIFLNQLGLMNEIQI